MLRAKIAEVLEARTEELTAGACKDYAAYIGEVQYLNGLRDALKYAEDVEREPDERRDSA